MRGHTARGQAEKPLIPLSSFPEPALRKVVRPVPPAPGAPSVDPATGRLISPIVAAGLCVKPRGMLTSARVAKVDVLKSELSDFAEMRGLAMRFRGILRSEKAGKLGLWVKDAQQSDLYAMQRFARTQRRDIDAVRSAITEQSRDDQTEGQINRLKTMKRAMYGRAGPELLRARELPV
jgi:transposase